MKSRRTPEEADSKPHSEAGFHFKNDKLSRQVMHECGINRPHHEGKEEEAGEGRLTFRKVKMLGTVAFRWDCEFEACLG